MADELEFITINALGTGLIDNTPGAVSTGYQHQNANLAGHVLGFDKSSLRWDVGTSKLVLDISGIIDENGLSLVTKAPVSLTLSVVGRNYIKLIAGSVVTKRSVSLVQTPGTYDAAKHGYYEAGLRVLDWMIYWNGIDAPLIIKRNPCKEPRPLETMIFPWADADHILQDDSVDSVKVPAGTYWNLGSPDLVNSIGGVPRARSNITFLQSGGAYNFWANRGILKAASGGHVAFYHTFANEMVIGIRFFPLFAYNIAGNAVILDTRRLANTSDDSFFLYYDATADKYRLIVQDDGTKNIDISTNQYLNNPSLQIATTIFIIISKVNNNADMYVNGTLIVNGVNGTKTLTGGAAAITGINLPACTSFVLNASAFASTGYGINTAQEVYYQDVWINNSYGTTYLVDWNASGDKPYFHENWLAGYKHDYMIDAYGGGGFNYLFANCASFDSLCTGAGQAKTVGLYWSGWNMDTTATLTILLSSYGLVATEILFAQCWVFPNAGTSRFDLLIGGAGSIDTVNPNSIILGRNTGGFFDAPQYNAAYGKLVLVFLV